jgi:hypothetical protein
VLDISLDLVYMIPLLSKIIVFDGLSYCWLQWNKAFQTG